MYTVLVTHLGILEPRRAAVGLIIRVVPDASTPLSALPPANGPQPSISEFFGQDWVNAPGARAELLFLKRSTPPASADNEAGSSSNGANCEAHVSFPGGRMDEEDENGLYTAMRQTWEELGIDLAERDYVCVGQLDDREITTSLGKRLLMILSPFVFLQLTPHTTPVDPLPEISLHWIPLARLAVAKPTWSSVTADISIRMAPRYPFLRRIIRLLLGSMRFAAIVLNEPRATTTSAKGKERATEPAPSQDILKLWGLTLGMTLDLLALLHPPRRPKLPLEPDADGLIGLDMAPSMASVFPRFSYPDVNFWIWCVRAREVIDVIADIFLVQGVRATISDSHPRLGVCAADRCRTSRTTGQLDRPGGQRVLWSRETCASRCHRASGDWSAARTGCWRLVGVCVGRVERGPSHHTLRAIRTAYMRLTGAFGR